MTREPVALYKDGYHRANRVGVMLMIITFFQYGVPTVFLQLLRLCGVDTAARSWGLPSPAYLFLYLLMYVLMMGAPMLLISQYCMPKKRLRLSPLNLSVDRRIGVVLCGVALCVLANVVASLFSGILYAVGVPEPELLSLGDGSILTLIMDLLVFAIVPAVMEEMLLRATVLQTLRPVGNGIAVTVSAVLFGLMHGNVAQTPYTLLMGLVLGAVFVYTDDLRLTVIVHALANALSLISQYMLQYRDGVSARGWQFVMLTCVLLSGLAGAVWLWGHPLGRSKPTYDVPRRERYRAVLAAPLLWMACAAMLILMIVWSV